MAREGVHWFFSLRSFPLLRFLRRGAVLDKEDFLRTCRFYIGDVTFAEAYERTGRHVTISVSSSSLAGHDGAEELLLNHVTTPNVLIRSAVMASCSLPGIMAPSPLLAKVGSKTGGALVWYPAREGPAGSLHHGMRCLRVVSQNSSGVVGPFYLDGVEWIDGSVQADIPFRGISTMFSVSNCIVSQVRLSPTLIKGVCGGGRVT
jgi:TAG lipase / steryl ester hydrolase / phospholipase A2 / LPA acyltransferase